jgi:hypothetical protein
MKWIKLYEEFTNDSMHDMLLNSLETEIREIIAKEGHFSMDDYYALVKSRKLDDRMADDIFHDLVGRGVSFSNDEEIVIEDKDFGLIFKFEKIHKQGEETYYWGTLYCPDYTYGGEDDEQETIPGELYGRFVSFEDGPTMLDFEGPNDLTAYDFCEGLEHELDNFAEYAVDEINKKINNNG